MLHYDALVISVTRAVILEFVAVVWIFQWSCKEYRLDSFIIYSAVSFDEGLFFSFESHASFGHASFGSVVLCHVSPKVVIPEIDP